MIVSCARCDPKGCNGRLRLCKPCFDAWPQGKNLEEYLNMKMKPDPIKCPDHLALKIRNVSWKKVSKGDIQ